MTPPEEIARPASREHRPARANPAALGAYAGRCGAAAPSPAKSATPAASPPPATTRRLAGGQATRVCQRPATWSGPRLDDEEQSMRKIVVSEFMSLDGVMQAPGGAEEDTTGGFTQGGWTQPYWHDDLGAHFFQAMSESDALLLGRKTWQGHGAAFEPMPEGDPFGDLMKAMPKYVVSTTMTEADVSAWRNSTLIKDNVVEQVRALKARPGKN